MEATVWSETFLVRAYEVDPEGRASVQTLCNFLQETAGNHASRLGLSMEHLASKNVTWVLSRLHLEVTSLPVWKETVRVTTWPSGENGLYATREYLVHGEDGAQIARATSAWMLLDVSRRRPVRIPAFVSEIRVPDRTRPIADDFPKLPRLSRPDYEQRFRVRFSDLDLNGHVNNVHYAEWVLETIPPETLQALQLARLEISFRAETNYGDTILARAEVEEGEPAPTFLHQLLRVGDEREVAQARTQ